MVTIEAEQVPTRGKPIYVVTAAVARKAIPPPASGHRHAELLARFRAFLQFAPTRHDGLTAQASGVACIVAGNQVLSGATTADHDMPDLWWTRRRMLLRVAWWLGRRGGGLTTSAVVGSPSVGIRGFAARLGPSRLGSGSRTV